MQLCLPCITKPVVSKFSIWPENFIEVIVEMFHGRSELAFFFLVCFWFFPPEVRKNPILKLIIDLQSEVFSYI